jgi:hypothetical protein
MTFRPAPLCTAVDQLLFKKTATALPEALSVRPLRLQNPR